MNIKALRLNVQKLREGLAELRTHYPGAYRCLNVLVSLVLACIVGGLSELTEEGSPWESLYAVLFLGLFAWFLLQFYLMLREDRAKQRRFESTPEYAAARAAEEREAKERRVREREAYERESALERVAMRRGGRIALRVGALVAPVWAGVLLVQGHPLWVAGLSSLLLLLAGVGAGAFLGMMTHGVKETLVSYRRLRKG